MVDNGGIPMVQNATNYNLPSGETNRWERAVLRSLVIYANPGNLHLVVINFSRLIWNANISVYSNLWIII